MATSLTPEEVHEFLQNQRTLIVTTLKKDGAPISHAMWFTYLDDAVYFDTQSASLKARNIERDDRVCCLVEAGEKYFDLRGVTIQGHCVAVHDPQEIARVEAAKAEKNARIGSGLEDMPEWFSESRGRRRERGARVLLKVPMEKISTWNFGQVRDHYAAKMNR
jgi:general stress protein 26